MLPLFVENPWLLVVPLIAGVIVSCTAIVVITEYFRSSHQLEVDAMLKQDMLNRGMSAADIKTVLEARSDGEAARLAMSGQQGVRVGLGSFQVEVGGTPPSAEAGLAAPAEAVAAR